MRRRPFLHLAVGAMATAGCLGTSETPEESPSSTTETTATETTSTTPSTSTGDSTTETAASDGPLTVERVETFDYAVRMNDLGHDPGGGIVRLDELADREQEVVERALDGGYETDDLPDWLVQFASRTPFVERSGTYYRVDHDFPTTTVTAEAVEESNVDGDIADYEAYEAAVTHDGRVMSGLLRIARREGMEFTYVWPSLQNFLDDYAAVRYHGDVVSMSAEVEDSGPPYGVSATEVPVSEAVRADVWNVSNADPDVRELVRRAGNFGGAYGFDSAPEGFFDRLESHRYAYLDGTFYTTYVEKRDPIPVSLSAEVAGESGAKLTLSLRNDADRELEISTGAPRPFGVLHADPVGDAEAEERTTEGEEGTNHHLLWTDAYEENDHVHTEGREVRAVNSIGLLLTLASGETASETYEVPIEDLPPGEYAVDESVGVEGGWGSGTGGDSEGGEDGGTVRYRVVFSVS